MGVCVYTPAFALNAGTKPYVFSHIFEHLSNSQWMWLNVLLLFLSVTGFELWGTVLATGLVCTLYTTMVSEVFFKQLNFSRFLLCSLHDQDSYLNGPRVRWWCSGSAGLYLSEEDRTVKHIRTCLIDSWVLCLFLTGRSEGCDLDGCLSDRCDVCRAAGSHCGGSVSDRRTLWSLEESLGGKSHFWSWVSLKLVYRRKSSVKKHTVSAYQLLTLPNSVLYVNLLYLLFMLRGRHQLGICHQLTVSFANTWSYIIIHLLHF